MPCSRTYSSLSVKEQPIRSKDCCKISSLVRRLVEAVTAHGRRPRPQRLHGHAERPTEPIRLPRRPEWSWCISTKAQWFTSNPCNGDYDMNSYLINGENIEADEQT